MSHQQLAPTPAPAVAVLHIYISLHKSLRILFLHKRRYILHEIEKIYIHTHKAYHQRIIYFYIFKNIFHICGILPSNRFYITIVISNFISAQINMTSIIGYLTMHFMNIFMTFTTVIISFLN